MAEGHSNWRDVKARRPTPSEREAAASELSQQEIAAYRLTQIRAKQEITQALAGNGAGTLQSGRLRPSP